MLTIEKRGGVVLVSDDSDGWIAERICGGRATAVIGWRDWQRLVDAGFAMA